MKASSMLLVSLGMSVSAFAGAAKRPNIIFILTDDLGYGDLGVFVQNERGRRGLPHHRTPNIDRMAGEGVRLNSHYCAAPVSAPSRASLLSGVSQGHASVRDNQFDKALADNHTLASVLRGAGYSTLAIGKWGLKGEGEAPGWEAHPNRRGFDYFFGYARHVDGHEHYPKEQVYYSKRKNKSGAIRLWDNTEDITDALDGCYTTDLFTARAKQWIVEHRKRSPEEPFFMYLAYDTPHAVLEYPPCAYPEGAGLRGGVQWVGRPGNMINTSGGVPDTWVHPDYASATYDHDNDAATPERPWPEVYKRHATVVRRIDDAVGDLIRTLGDLGIDEDTVIVFSSDNGPAAESYIGEKYSPEFFSTFGPFDGIKRDTLEGGLRVPTLVRWPGNIPAGRSVDRPSAMWDWMPTFAELAGVPAPARTDGESLLKTLKGQDEERERRRAIYVEYAVDKKTPAYKSFEPFRRGRMRGQMQSIRDGDLVGVRYDIKSGDDDFEIYNVAHDPKQAKNLAGKAGYAGVQERFKALALQLRRPNESAQRPYDDAFVPGLAVLPGAEPGLSWKRFDGNFPWLPDFSSMSPSAEGDCDGLDYLPVRDGEAAGLCYEGYLNVPNDGEYVFELETDGSALLRIHDATVIDADFGYAGGSKVSGCMRLKAGLHPFRLSYGSKGHGKPMLSLRWGDAGQEDMTGGFVRKASSR